MKHKFSNIAPLLRLVFAVAALSVSLSIGGFIDFLATGYTSAANGKQHTLLTAERKVIRTSFTFLANWRNHETD